jgi:hypothetical protein
LRKGWAVPLPTLSLLGVIAQDIWLFLLVPNCGSSRGISSEVETLHGSEIPENQESGPRF